MTLYSWKQHLEKKMQYSETVLEKTHLKNTNSSPNPQESLRWMRMQRSEGSYHHGREMAFEHNVSNDSKLSQICQARR